MPSTKRPVNPGKECTVRLEKLGIKARVYPSYNGVLKFFTSANKAIIEMDKNDIACVKKSITHLNRGADDPVVKKVIREERIDFLKKADQRVKRIDSKHSGTVLKLATKPTRRFEEFR